MFPSLLQRRCIQAKGSLRKPRKSITDAVPDFILLRSLMNRELPWHFSREAASAQGRSWMGGAEIVNPESSFVSCHQKDPLHDCRSSMAFKIIKGFLAMVAAINGFAGSRTKLA